MYVKNDIFPGLFYITMKQDLKRGLLKNSMLFIPKNQRISHLPLLGFFSSTNLLSSTVGMAAMDPYLSLSLDTSGGSMRAMKSG